MATTRRVAQAHGLERLLLWLLASYCCWSRHHLFLNHDSRKRHRPYHQFTILIVTIAENPGIINQKVSSELSSSSLQSSQVHQALLCLSRSHTPDLILNHNQSNHKNGQNQDEDPKRSPRALFASKIPPGRRSHPIERRHTSDALSHPRTCSTPIPAADPNHRTGTKLASEPTQHTTPC